SVFARQKDLAALGEMQPEERKVAINRLINIDAIDKARKLALERRTSAENELRGMQAMIKDTGELERRIEEYRQAVQHENAAVELAQKSVQDTQKKLEAQKNEFARLSETRDRYQALTADIGRYKSESAAVDRQLQDNAEELKRIENSEKQLTDLEKERRRYLEVRAKKEEFEKLRIQSERLQKFQEDLAYHQQQIEDEQKIILRLQKEISGAPDPDTAFDNLDAKWETLRQEEIKLREKERKFVAKLGAIESKGKEARTKREKIIELGNEGPCPVCTRPLGEHHSTVLQHFESELNILRDEYRDADQNKRNYQEKLGLNKEAQNELQIQREQLTEAITLVRRKRQELKEYQTRQNQFRERAKGVQVEIEKLGEIAFNEKDYIQILAEHEKLNKIHEHALKLERDVERKNEISAQKVAIENKRQEIKETLEKLEKAVANLKFDEESYVKAKQHYEDDLEHLNHVRSTLAEADKALVAARTRMQNAEQELERARSELKKLAHLKEEKQYYEALAYHFGRFRLQLAGRLRPLIAARSSELLRLTSSGRYSLLELDEDYNIFILDQGQSFPLQRFSGGEQDLANLCLRVAISQVVAERSGKTPVQFIVLDEVFGSQDMHRQQLIMEALQHLQSQFRQIFIISHVETIKEILPVIFQVEMTSAFESKAYMV
ncbi:MAG: SbcC/MukB-like Walker B domain-containing protein, partial [bacterium]